MENEKEEEFFAEYLEENFASFEASDAAIDAMNGQYLCNRPISVSYAFKKDSKGERHGSAAERLLAAQNPLSHADRPLQLFADAPVPQMMPPPTPMMAAPPPLPVGMMPPPPPIPPPVPNSAPAFPSGVPPPPPLPPMPPSNQPPLPPAPRMMHPWAPGGPPPQNWRPPPLSPRAIPPF